MTLFKVSQFLWGLYVPIDDDLISRRAVKTIGLTVGNRGGGLWREAEMVYCLTFYPTQLLGRRRKKLFFYIWVLFSCPFLSVVYQRVISYTLTGQLTDNVKIKYA